jgi:thiol-disulfide isomerase/thioredoxin
LFKEYYNEYQLDSNITESLRVWADKIVIVVISAAWCKDCRFAIPVLRHLHEQIGLETRIFGKVKTDPLNPDRQWAVPPSPPEVDEWAVKAIPWIVIFDKNGNELATIIEKPQAKPTLEAEILHVLK